MGFRFDGEDQVVGQPAGGLMQLGPAAQQPRGLGGNKYGNYRMAPAAAQGAHAMAMGQSLAASPPSWMKTVSAQGVSTPDEEMDTLPFIESLNNGVIDPTHLELQFVSFPQRPFRGERLIISAFSATVSDPASLLVIDPAMYVGATQIGATQGRVPITMFAPNAFGVRLSFPEAGQGTRVFIPIVALASPGAGNSISVSVGLIGRAVR